MAIGTDEPVECPWARPRIVVLEKRNFEHEDIYEDEIQTYLGIGYFTAFRKSSTDPDVDYIVLEEER